MSARNTASGRQGPQAGGGGIGHGIHLKTAVSHQLHGHDTDGAGAQGAVIVFLRAAGFGVDRVGPADHVSGGVGGTGTAGAAGVVKEIVGVDIIRSVLSPVRAVILIYRLTSVRVGDGAPDAVLPGCGRGGRIFCFFRIAGDPSPAVAKGHHPAGLGIIQVRQPVQEVRVPGDDRAVTADGIQGVRRVGIRQGIYISRRVCDLWYVSRRITEGSKDHLLGAGILLGDLRDPPVGIGHTDLIAVSVFHPGQETVGKGPKVALVIGHLIIIGTGASDLQPQTVLIVIVAGLFFLILPEVVEGSVPVMVAQVVDTGYGLRLHFLNDIQSPAGTQPHVQSQSLGDPVYRGVVVAEIIQVVDQVQGEGVRAGRIAQQLLDHLQLSGAVCHVGHACLSGVVG